MARRPLCLMVFFSSVCGAAGAQSTADTPVQAPALPPPHAAVLPVKREALRTALQQAPAALNRAGTRLSPDGRAELRAQLRNSRGSNAQTALP
jgi:uncharacterized membrane protein